MLDYPHRPDETVLRDFFEAAQDRFVHSRGRVPPELPSDRSERFLLLNSQTGLDCACIAHALALGEDQVLDYLQQSLAWFMAALERQLPFNLAQLRDRLSVALVLGDASSVAVLSGLPRERYAVAGVEFPEAIHLSFELYADLAGRRPTAGAQRLQALDALLGREPLPRPIRGDIESALQLQRLVLHRDSTDTLATALRQRVASHVARLKNPLLQQEPLGLLDLWGLGLLRLAHRDGLAPPEPDSVYLPAFLAQG
jgi:Immunity protein 49